MFPAVPVIVKIAFAPEQIGLLDVRVAAFGVAGCAFTVTLDEAALVHVIPPVVKLAVTV